MSRESRIYVAERSGASTYSVVKFMVKVKLMENNVNSQVGSVIVVKVIAQYRTLGTIWNRNTKTRPTKDAMVKRVEGSLSGDEVGGICEQMRAGELEEEERVKDGEANEAWSGSRVTDSVGDVVDVEPGWLVDQACCLGLVLMTL